MLKHGSFCTGYGGLDMAVEHFYDAELKMLGNGVVPQQALLALALLNE